MPPQNWMIYGANGYTGRLIAEAAKKAGLRPVLAGRNAKEIGDLGHSLGLETKVFSCRDEAEIALHLAGFPLVLHCAGPFSATASPMVKACMRTKTNYLDITGEIAVFEKILSRSADIAKAGIVAIPGVGFDVVPSDCLAAMLKAELPDAQELELVLKPSGPLSPGTTKTMVEGFYVGTVIREAGKIRIMNEFTTAKRPFRDRIVDTIGIAWGDIATAFYSTGIPNIRIFLVSSPGYIRFLRTLQKFRALWKTAFMQMVLKKLVEWRVQGPDDTLRADAGYKLWGTVRNSAGKSVEMGISTTNGYTFTVDSALEIVRRMLSSPPAPGAYTPSLAFGAKFVLDLPQVELLKN